jgi:hypothetical protein
MLLVLAACATAGPSGTEGPDATTGPDTSGPFGVYAASLQRFNQCDDLLDYYVTHALDQVGPYGLNGNWWGGPIPMMAVEESAAATDAAAPAPGGSRLEAGVYYSVTNVQTEGVDEPDMVKTNGTHIFSLIENRLIVTAVDGADLTHVDVLEFKGDEWFNDMLLDGDTILLTGQSWSGQSEVVSLVEVDVADPSDIKVVRRMQIDGRYVSSRLAGGVVRLVIRSYPVGFEWAMPEGSGLRSERDATEKNEAIIRESTFDNWLPYFVLTNEVTGAETDGVLADCGRVYAPPSFSGLATVSVLSFDLDSGGLSNIEVDGVVAEGETIYASTDALYIATQRWIDWGIFQDTNESFDAAEEFRTQIHKFTFAGDHVNYEASGEVPGFLNGQWAMSEYEGDLRVASTLDPWGWWTSETSESFLSVLRPDGGELAEIGQVDGLGRGERIYAVRFIGTTGYVVTFRQTDPLYVIDISDPTSPTVAGELKILGYSAYLHPVADGLLVGIGQDADERGRTEGTQFSLFDVSDPSNPERIDQITFEGGYSQAEWDHHAILFWAAEDLLFAPYQMWQWEEKTEKQSFDAGALAIRVGDQSLSHEATLRNGLDGPFTYGEDDVAKGEEEGRWIDPWRAQINRIIIIGDHVFTIGWNGIGIHTLDGLQTLDLEPWA